MRMDVTRSKQKVHGYPLEELLRIPYKELNSELRGFLLLEGEGRLSLGGALPVLM